MLHENNSVSTDAASCSSTSSSPLPPLGTSLSVLENCTKSPQRDSFATSSSFSPPSPSWSLYSQTLSPDCQQTFPFFLDTAPVMFTAHLQYPLSRKELAKSSRYQHITLFRNPFVSASVPTSHRPCPSAQTKTPPSAQTSRSTPSRESSSYSPLSTPPPRRTPTPENPSSTGPRSPFPNIFSPYDEYRTIHARVESRVLESAIEAYGDLVTNEALAECDRVNGGRSGKFVHQHLFVTGRVETSGIVWFETCEWTDGRVVFDEAGRRRIQY